MKKALVLGLALALVGGVAYANFCARDVVPAATILVPYVVVDVTASGAPDDTGVTTLTGITNVSRDAIVVHFTAWDATSDPKVDFDEILSGYDVIQINWRDFMNGRFDFFDTSRTAFTVTAPYIFDPFEWGPDGRGQGGGLTAPANRNISAWPNCKPNGNNYGPAYGNRSDLASTIQSLLQGVLVGYDHDGCFTPGNLRSNRLGLWEDLTADPTFFYVTADVVLDCNLFFPNNASYWGTGIASSANVLIGDTIYLDSTNGYSEMMPAVHIEANQQWGRTLDENEFYGEKLPIATATWREPLATAFAFRYANDTAGGISSHVILWKNYAEFTSAGDIDDCGSYVYYAWDMDERSLSTTTEPISGLPSSGRDPNQFPFETQKVPLVSQYFDLPGSYGWMLIVLPPSYGTFTDPTNPGGGPTDNPFYQGWAGLTFEWAGYSAGTDAATMANANCLPDQVLPALGANTGVFPVDWNPAI